MNKKIPTVYPGCIAMIGEYFLSHIITVDLLKAFGASYWDYERSMFGIISAIGSRDWVLITFDVSHHYWVQLDDIVILEHPPLELLPCAHCGGEAKYNSNNSQWHVIYCTKCFISTGVYKTKIESFINWNTRDGILAYATPWIYDKGYNECVDNL